MNILLLFVLACTVASVSAQECPPLAVAFLLDISENAEAAATDKSDFDLMIGSFTTFMNDPAIASSGTNVSVAIYGYNSNGAVTFVPPWSTASSALPLLSSIAARAKGGSWTYVGFSVITTPPPIPNNLLIVISSQGSTAESRYIMAVNEANRVKNLGWNIQVISVQGKNPFNDTELRAVNNGQPVPTVKDRAPGASPKGYRYLATDELSKLPGRLGCTGAPPPTVDEICSQCLYESGTYNFPDPLYCDSFIDCHPKPPVRRGCGAGTFFDNGICNFIDTVKCPIGACTTSTPANTFYPSFTCCNEYFECTGGKLLTRKCPDGQMFNNATKACENIVDKQAGCPQPERRVCDVKPVDPPAPTEPQSCICRVDDAGDPCYFICDNRRMLLPAGTAWRFCSLVLSQDCQPSNDTTNRDLATACTANFLATFNGGQRQVYNERAGNFINVYSTVQEANIANNMATFTSSMTRPYVYYFYLNNVDFGVNVAFRLQFNLKNPTIGVMYDLLSNNYCKECPATISFTITATSATDRSVTAMFQTNAVTITTSATISVSNADNFLELRVVFGDTTVYGVLKELSADSKTVVKTSQFTTVNKPAGSTVNTNRCGMLLGNGPNNSFVGVFTELAVYRFCTDISTVTK